MHLFRMIVLLLIVLCLVPPLVLLTASLLARWAGCDIDPDAQIPCKILEGDYGNVLYSMTHFGWNAVWTLPVLAALLVGWIAVEALRTLGRPRKPAVRQTPATSRNRARGS
jgi:hypothetical protein